MSDSRIPLSNLLNDEQRSMLTDNAANLTKEDLHNLQSNPSLDGRLSAEDHSSIRKLAIHRANSGQTLLTFSHMELDTSADSGDGGGFESNW